MIIDRDGASIRETFTTEKKSTAKPADHIAGDCGGSPDTPTPLGTGRSTGIKPYGEKDSRPVATQ